jgi:MFS family permease
VLLAVAFVAVELRASEPILPMRLFRSSIFSIANLFGFLVGIAMFGSMIFLPVYLQVVQGMSPTASGLAMLPMVVGLFSTSITAGRMMTRNGRYKIFPILGSSIVIVGLLMLSQLSATSPYWFAGLSMYVLGAGLGFTMQVLVTIVQNAVSRSDMADALAGAPAGAASRAGGSADLANNVEAIKALPEPVHSLVTGAFSNALHDTFLSAVPLVVVALVVALFLKEKPLATRDSVAGPSAPESEPETVAAPAH